MDSDAPQIGSFVLVTAAAARAGATGWGAVPVPRSCSSATAFLSLVLVAATSAGAGISGVPTVTDGDTLRIGSERIRLHAIDVPESVQSSRAGGKTWPCGEAATWAGRASQRPSRRRGTLIPPPR